MTDYSGVSFTLLRTKQYPVSGKKLLLNTFDKWRGKGNESEIISATFDGETFFHAENGRQVDERFIVGWHELPESNGSSDS